MDGYKVKTKSFLKHVKDSGGVVALIAKRMNVERTTLIAWLNRNPSFWEYVYEERENIVDIAEAKLIQKLNNNEDWAIKFVLGSTNRGRRRGYEGNSIVVNNETNTGPTYKFEIIKPDESTYKVETEQETTNSV